MTMPQVKILSTEALETISQIKMLQNMAISTEDNGQYSMQKYARTINHVVEELEYILSNLNTLVGN